ncbi:MAG: hypothetical protein WAN20_06175 [Pseudonocardiaceae bacterium]|jgi:uncharacterized membrane-anchored protein YhcB (DUF1043 family)
MNTFGLIVLAAILLVIFGVLIGCTISELLLRARARRQAAVQRALNEQWQEINEQWQEIEAATQTIAQRTGEPRKPVRR